MAIYFSFFRKDLTEWCISENNNGLELFRNDKVHINRMNEIHFWYNVKLRTSLQTKKMENRIKAFCLKCCQQHIYLIFYCLIFTSYIQLHTQYNTFKFVTKREN